MNSHNHVMLLGDLGHLVFMRICRHNTAEPGFNKITWHPAFPDSWIPWKPLTDIRMGSLKVVGNDKASGC